MNKVRTLISDSGLDKTFWAELINTATNLINRTLLKKSGNTAYEMLTGKEASVKHLKRIGCKTHFSVLPRRGKLDMRSRRGILLGYEEDFRVYRIYDSENKKVITSRDVYFDEERMPLKQVNKDIIGDIEKTSEKAE